MDETALPVSLPRGRSVTAAAFGPRDGTPVLSMHGTPGSRLQPPPDPAVLERAGIRLLTYDRPGYGTSPALQGRRVADAAADAALVADAIGVHHFSVIGYSGGGPHALAVAALLPDRVTRCATVASIAPLDAHGLDFFAGMSPGNVEEFDAALAGRDSLTAMLEPVAAIAVDDVYAFLAALAADLPGADADQLRRPDVEQMLTRSVAEGLRPGPGGWVDDDLAFCAPWGFDLGGIAAPVAIWHGAEDTLVPASHAAWLARAVPGAEGHLIVGVGHFGVLECLDEAFRWLVG